MVHSRSANSGEEMENLSATTLGVYTFTCRRELLSEGLQLALSASTLLGWSQFERLAVNEVDKRPAFRWGQNVLSDVSALY